MKKFRKILIPLLVLSLLVGIFAVVAAADGSYVADREQTYSGKNNLTLTGVGSDVITDESYIAYDGTTVNYVKIADGDGIDNGGYLNLPELGATAEWSDVDAKWVRNYYYSLWSFDVTCTSGSWATTGLKFFGKYNTYSSTASAATGTNLWGKWGTGTNFTSVGFEQDPEAFTWHNITIIIEYETGVVNSYIDGAFYSTIDLYNDGTLTLDLIDNRFHFPTEDGYDYGISNVTLKNFGTPGALDALFDGNKAALSATTAELPYKTAADITPAPPVAKIGEQGYKDFATAYAAVEEGGTITLLGNVITEATIDKACVIDTNGFNFNYTVTSDYVAAVEGNVITITEWDPDAAAVEVVFYDAEGQVIDMTEIDVDGVLFGVTVGTQVPANLIPTMSNSLYADFAGWEDQMGNTYTNGITAADVENTGVLELSPVFTTYEAANVAAAVEYNGSFTRYTSDKLADFDAAFKAGANANAKYHLLEDYTFTNMEYGGAGCTLYIHGVKATWSNSSARFFQGRYTAKNFVIEGVTVGEKRAEMEVTGGWELIYSDTVPSTLTLKNIDLTTPKLCDIRCGSLTIVDCNIECYIAEGNEAKGYGRLIQLAPASGVTCDLTIEDSTLSTTGTYINWRGATANDPCVNIEGAGNKNIYLNGNTVIETTATTCALGLTFNNNAGTATLYLSSGAVVKAGSGAFGLSNSNTGLVVTIQEGFTWKEVPTFSSVSAQNVRLDGEGYGYFKQVGANYVYTKAETFVELTFVVGSTSTVVPIIDGNTDVELPAVADTFEVVGGKVMVSQFSHWSDTEGGAEANIQYTEDATYYAVYTTAEAENYVVYDASDNIIAGGTGIMDSSVVGITGISKIVLLKDTTLDFSAYTDWSSAITVDLGGYILTVISSYDDPSTDGDQDARFTLKANATFTNGTLNLTHNNNLFYASAGNLTLTDLTINMVATLVDYRVNGGTVTVTDCTVNATLGSAAAFNLGTYGNDATFIFTNVTATLTDSNPEDSGNPRFVQIAGKDDTINVKGTITLDGCTINAGGGTPMHVSYYAAEGSTVTFNILNGTKLGTTLSTVCSGGCKNLEVVINLDDDVQLDKVHLPFANMYFVCSEGKAPVMQAEGSDYAYAIGTMDTAVSQVLSNLTLYTDINLNFFVPTVDGVAYRFAINGVEVPTTYTTYCGATYYRIAAKGIKPIEAAEGEFVLTMISYNGVKVDVTLGSTSVLGYVNAALAADFSAESKALIANVVDYIAAAYAYNAPTAELPAALTAVMASENYTNVVANYNRGEIGATSANAAGATNAIADVQLNLTSGLKYRLNLKNTYSGTLLVNGVAYEVVEGYVGENAYIEVTVLACNMLAEDITVVDEANGVNGSLDLEYYIAADKTDDAEDGKGDLAALLEALYYYCEAAEVYEATQIRS